MKGSKSFKSALATLEGIEVAHMIRISAICGSGRITASSQIHESAVRQNLRQNQIRFRLLKP
jgi:hypothetical protein